MAMLNNQMVTTAFMGFINQLIIGGSHLVYLCRIARLPNHGLSAWHPRHTELRCPWAVPTTDHHFDDFSQWIYSNIFCTCIHCILIYIYNGDTYIHALIHNAYQCISIHNIIYIQLYTHYYTISYQQLINININNWVDTLIIPYHINNELMARHKPSAFVSPTAPHIVGPSKWS